MSDIHALSGAYAIDALDVDERDAFEAHMRGCETCRAEVSSLREAASSLSALSTLTPSHDLRRSILGSIGQVRPLPPLVTGVDADAADDVAAPVPAAADLTKASAGHPDDVAPGDDLAARRERRRGGARVADRSHRGRWLAAAAAVVLIGGVGTGVVVTQPWGDDTTQQVSVADQVIGASDVVTQTAKVEGGTATLYRSASLDKAVLSTEDMRDPGQGSVYQMWLQAPDGAFVDAGLMPKGAEHTVVLKGAAADAIGAGITVEPKGGSEQPTSEPVALFDLRADA